MSLVLQLKERLTHSTLSVTCSSLIKDTSASSPGLQNPSVSTFESRVIPTNITRAADTKLLQNLYEHLLPPVCGIKAAQPWLLCCASPGDVLPTRAFKSKHCREFCSLTEGSVYINREINPSALLICSGGKNHVKYCNRK